MGHLPARGTTSIVIDADPADVWAVVADPTRVGEWSHETRQASWVPPATEAAVGAQFVGRNRTGAMKWRRRNEVLALEPGRSIAWRTVPTPLYNDSTRWTLRVEPDEGGTRLTQDFEVLKLHPLLDRLYYLLIPKHRDRSDALRTDLERIGEVARARARPAAGRAPHDGAQHAST